MADAGAYPSPAGGARDARGARRRPTNPAASAARSSPGTNRPPWTWLDESTLPAFEPGWRLEEDGFNLAREHEIESLLAVSNGHIGIRASLAEGSELSEPGVFVAGVFASPPEADGVPEMLMLDPGWMHLRTAVNGYTLDFHTGKTLFHRRVLDMRHGILWRAWRHEDPDGRTTWLRYLRLASVADRCLIAQSILIIPENYGGRLKLSTSASDPPPRTLSALDPPRALDVGDPSSLDAGDGESWHEMLLSLEAPGTETSVVVASASCLRVEESVVQPTIVEGRRGPTERWEVDVDVGSHCRLDRLISIQTGRSAARPRRAALEHLRRATSRTVTHAVREHVTEWDRLWEGMDVEIDGDAAAQQAIRFACHHLMAAANPEDDRSSIGARALTGQAYKGHVFWDTEIYMLPFFTLTHPDAARALLMYRHHTLDAARAKARHFGFRGALYAWESTQTGGEATPSFVIAPDGEVVVIRNAEQEIHISGDIAYAIWHYWRATGDDTFMREAGAEIVLETARFWASRTRLGEDGLRHIDTVIGPDEYHESVDDNAYTNGLARWNLERGVEMAGELRDRWPEAWARIRGAIELDEDEIEVWREQAERMYTGHDPETGLIEQFRGYYGLEEIDLAEYEPRAVPMDIILGRERTQRSQVIKQPDVLMLIYLFWDAFSAREREANYRFYEPRCGHGSSLSPSIHALLAARLGKMEAADRYFRQAAEIDLANNMGNAAGGVHAAALGGLWQAVIFGYAGVQLHDSGFTIDPRLPERWRRLRFRLCWRGQRLLIEIDGERGEVAVRHTQGDDSILVGVGAEDPVELTPGGMVTGGTGRRAPRSGPRDERPGSANLRRDSDNQRR